MDLDANLESIKKYCSLLDEIKRRMRVIDAFGMRLSNALYVPTTTESVYLQFRKILELIALGSLVANKQAFSKVYANFAKYWNAELLLKDVERINPNFYPHPIIQRPSLKPGIAGQLFDRGNDFLTKDELVKLYKKCGAIMHSNNPYGSQIDYDYYAKNIPFWRNRIINLLGAHTMHLIDDPQMYLMQMGSDNELPTYTIFTMVYGPFQPGKGAF